VRTLNSLKIRVFFKLKFIVTLPLLVLLLEPFQAYATTYTIAKWSFNNSLAATSCSPPPGTSCPSPSPTATPLINGAAPIFSPYGRESDSLVVSNLTNGYQVKFAQNNNINYGFAWMGFIWVKELNDGTQAILWHEGYDSAAKKHIAGMTIALNQKGQVVASVGHNGQWVTTLQSINTVGVNTWHHVALIWDTYTYYLMVNGVQQASINSSIPPDESPNVPITFGSFYNNGNPKYLLSGFLDEFKFIKFNKASFFPKGTTPSSNFVLGEHGLMFRLTILQDLIGNGVISKSEYNSFNSGTFKYTSILRAWINSFFTTSRAGLPFDPLGPANNGFENYVYPTNGVLPATNPESASLYLRLKNSKATGFCGAAALTLWGVFKALGYPTRYYDWMNNADFEYTGSHVLTEVYLPEANQYVMQDPTYNLGGYNEFTSSYNGAMDLYVLHKNVPLGLPFDNGGYNFNSDPVVNTNVSPDSEYPTFAAYYFSLFDAPATIFDTWSQSTFAGPKKRWHETFGVRK
jgi:hypothetical protein